MHQVQVLRQGREEASGGGNLPRRSDISGLLQEGILGAGVLGEAHRELRRFNLQQGSLVHVRPIQVSDDEGGTRECERVAFYECISILTHDNKSSFPVSQFAVVTCPRIITI